MRYSRNVGTAGGVVYISKFRVYCHDVGLKTSEPSHGFIGNPNYVLARAIFVCLVPTVIVHWWWWVLNNMCISVAQQLVPVIAFVKLRDSVQHPCFVHIALLTYLWTLKYSLPRA